MYRYNIKFIIVSSHTQCFNPNQNQIENYPCQIYNGGFLNVGENAYVNQQIILQFI